jgi:hypothetical protein
LWPGFDSCCNGRQFKKGDNIYVWFIFDRISVKQLRLSCISLCYQRLDGWCVREYYCTSYSSKYLMVCVADIGRSLILLVGVSSLSFR